MRHLYRLLNWIRHAFRRNKPGDWMDTPAMDVATPRSTPVSFQRALDDYEPEKEFRDIEQTPVVNPVIAFHEALEAEDPNQLPDSNPFKGRKIEVEEAYVFEAFVDERGHILKDKKIMQHREAFSPFRVRRVDGATYRKLVRESKKLNDAFPSYVQRVKESRAKLLKNIRKMKESRLLEDIDFAQDATSTPYDSAQYTEYTPLYGGPFNKQLYLTDYLTMHARAYEQWNHHPIAKRIVQVISQYAFGRRFKSKWKDQQKEKVWNDHNLRFNITHRLAEYWIKEFLIYGELMIDKNTFQSIDPSSVWDIITDPDDITDVFYYYQSYSTAYQTFTGYRVPGAPGAEKQVPLRYIIRQIPGKQVLHIKGNVVSQEKRGRSILYPILGWLKRIKDLYDAQVVRAQLQASFVWDIQVKGSASDVTSFIAQYASMPKKATDFIHNEAVTRTALPAMPSGESGNSNVATEILAFIATAIGIPKDFFNLISTGGGNRATALVGAEPFEKVIEDIQAKFETLLLDIARDAIESAGYRYEEGDVEFIFPSVTKDTTSETIKNIGIGETLGYIDHETAAEMYAAEMNITGYDYEDQQGEISKFKRDNPTPGMPPEGRFGNIGTPTDDGSVPDDVSPIHGQGKSNLKGQLNHL